MPNTAAVSNSYPAAFSVSHRRLQTAWQMVVLPRPIRPANARDLTRAVSSEVRFDAPHAMLSAPHYLLNWSDFVGLHPSSALQPLPAQPRGIGKPHLARTLLPAAVETDELLAEAAHEVRTPIAGALQALMMVTTQRKAGQTLDERELKLLQAAQVRLMQANRWAEDILSERSLAVRQHAGVRRRFYPEQWRQELVPIVQAAADKQNVTLEWDGWDRSLPRMYMDANHLSRIVMNLIMNAIQASPQGSRVTIRVAAQSSASQRLLISIEDRGIGLDAQLMRLINSSQPWPRSASSDLPSHGLGLRMVKSLMDSIGGAISVQRGAQGGTLFRLALPVDDLRCQVRQWLLKIAAENGLHAGSRLAIYAIKATEVDNELVDRHLQLSASGTEFVYRIGISSWLWMQLTAEEVPAAVDVHSLTSKLNVFGRRAKAGAQCLADMVCTLTDLPFSVRQAAPDDAQRLRSLLETVYDHAQRLMAGRVPPLDYVATSIQAAGVSAAGVSAAVEARSSAAQPIAGESGKRSISDVAKQWRVIHSKLEKLHSRHLRPAPVL
jgi:signal transduction histidine kinase